jgi:alpha-tubulin suppressor-like RCC1 family protein
LGASFSANQESPRKIPSLNVQLQSITAGKDNFCVLTDTGEQHCWGRNDQNQLSSVPGDLLAPTSLNPGFTDILYQALSASARCIVLYSNAAVQCQGDDAFGQLGNVIELRFDILFLSSNLSVTDCFVIQCHGAWCVAMSQNFMLCTGMMYCNDVLSYFLRWW